jgi:capsular exopolysaccharide synthesis family protein
MADLENINNNNQTQGEETIQIKDFLYLCIANWKWFVLSLIIVLLAAFVYLLRTPPTYTRTASVLIKTDSKGKSMSSELDAFADLGLFQSNTNVNNELIAFESPAVMTDVVKRLDLQMNYYLPGSFHKDVAYGDNLPVSVAMPGFTEEDYAELTVEVLPDGKVMLSDFSKNDEAVDGNPVTGKMMSTLVTPLGNVIVRPTPNYKGGEYYTLDVVRTPLHATVDAYSKKLTVSLNNEKASVIDLSFKDLSIKRAEDVLNMLINVYNENWIKDKNQIAVSTSMFIDERLAVIEKELGNVDSDISSFKSENLLPDVQAASAMYMDQSSSNNQRILELNNQLYMTKYVRNYLVSDNSKNQLLPVNSGIDNAHIESQISDYNDKVLQRNNFAANSGSKNPLVVDLDHAIASLRSAIITSIDNQLVTLNAQISSLLKTEQQTTSRIAANPTQAKYLLSVERQQKVKEVLYLFLLQKREENELSQSFTAYNTRVVTPPTGSLLPTSPVRNNILLIAFLIGLIIPAGILFLRETLHTTIRGRKDLESLTVPFIGEIPRYMHRKKGILGRKSPNVKAIVVKEGSRDVINEAFRVLRTNLEFMSDGDNGHNVIAITSFNPGSGKSFLTMNIATSLAIKGKKVLVVDGDLRHASASSYVGSPTVGLADYLAGKAADYRSLIVTDNSHGGMQVLPVGTFPPNPTELLFDKRLENLIEEMKGQYDYIFIDCPPIELVADTQIIEKLVDRTIFVVRAGLLERSMLPELEKIYTDKKFKNMSMILNGTESSGGRYGNKYGYRYGYHYGYGSGSYYGSKSYYGSSSED